MKIIENKPRGCAVSLFLVLHLFFLVSGYAAAQETEVSNITFSDMGDTIVVQYDLSGDPGKRFDVRLSLSDNGGKSFRVIPKALSGDVGRRVETGENKTIYWDMFKDFPYGIIGDTFVFKVEAVYKKRNSNFWFYAAGAGTVFGLYLFTRPQGTSTLIVEIPAYY